MKDNNSGDTIITQDVLYDGMSMALRAKRVVELEVTNANWPVPLGLNVGVESSRVRRLLGQPSMTGSAPDGSERFSYCERDNCVHFLTRSPQGIISRVHWSFYYD